MALAQNKKAREREREQLNLIEEEEEKSRVHFFFEVPFSQLMATWNKKKRKMGKWPHLSFNALIFIFSLSYGGIVVGVAGPAKYIVGTQEPETAVAAIHRAVPPFQFFLFPTNPECFYFFFFVKDAGGRLKENTERDCVALQQ